MDDLNWLKIGLIIFVSLLAVRILWWAFRRGIAESRENQRSPDQRRMRKNRRL